MIDQNEKLSRIKCVAKYQAAKEVYSKVCNEVSSILTLHYIVPETKMNWSWVEMENTRGKKPTGVTE